MSKGETLDGLLEKTDQACHAMRQIFIRKGMVTPDLSALPKKEYEQWCSLKAEVDGLTSEINRVVMSN